MNSWRIFLCFTVGVGSTVVFNLPKSYAQSAPDTDLKSKADSEEIKEDFLNLNSAFLISKEIYLAAVKRGEEASKRKKHPEKFYEEFRKTPVWQKGKKGKADGAVWTYGMNGDDFAIGAFRAATLYEKLEAPSSLENAPFIYARSLAFTVVLRSFPKIGTSKGDQIAAALSSYADNLNGTPGATPPPPERVLAEADVKDVDVIKIVLSDDKGNHYPADIVDAKNDDGTTTFRGVSQVETRDRVSTDVSASATAFGRSESVTAFGNARINSTYSRTSLIPYSTQHPYYQAEYRVEFPLFGKSGIPILAKDCKKFILRIITPKGEMTVDYNLDKPKK